VVVCHDLNSGAETRIRPATGISRGPSKDVLRADTRAARGGAELVDDVGDVSDGESQQPSVAKCREKLSVTIK
jgi:hypothetical protein